MYKREAIFQAQKFVRISLFYHNGFTVDTSFDIKAYKKLFPSLSGYHLCIKSFCAYKDPVFFFLFKAPDVKKVLRLIEYLRKFPRCTCSVSIDEVIIISSFLIF